MMLRCLQHSASFGKYDICRRPTWGGGFLHIVLETVQNRKWLTLPGNKGIIQSIYWITMAGNIYGYEKDGTIRKFQHFHAER